MQINTNIYEYVVFVFIRVCWRFVLIITLAKIRYCPSVSLMSLADFRKQGCHGC